MPAKPLRQHLTNRAHFTGWNSEVSAHEEAGASVRDVRGRTLEEAREEDQRDYRVRKSRVDSLGRRQAQALWLCCGLLAATIPVPLLASTWIPAWWPLAIMGACVGIFGMVAVMRWLLAALSRCLCVEPPKSPEQTTLADLSGRPARGPDSGGAG